MSGETPVSTDLLEALYAAIKREARAGAMLEAAVEHRKGCTKECNEAFENVLAAGAALAAGENANYPPDSPLADEAQGDGA